MIPYGTSASASMTSRRTSGKTSSSEPARPPVSRSRPSRGRCTARPSFEPTGTSRTPIKAGYPDVWRLNRPGYCTCMTDVARHSDASSGDAVPGDPAPSFSTPASTGKTLSLGDFLGLVPVAMTFVGTLPRRSADDVIDALNDVFPEFGRHRVQLLIVTPEPPDAVERRRRNGTTAPLLADED